MEYIYVIVAVFIALIVLSVLIVIREEKLNNKVIANSKKIALLSALNKEIKFHNITDHFKIIKHYDNKSSYIKIEPAHLMSSEIRSNIPFFADYISKIKENRTKKAQYQNKIKSILATEYSVNYSELKMSEHAYLKRESKLFSNMIIFPVTECLFLVSMSYSSPKGKVNLSKGDSFKFNDLLACFDSVSRTRLDKKTYNALSTVERGEISDSLRYDILSRDNFTCVICGVSARQGARLHVDHIVPISKGGKSIPENLRTLCERCNIGKSNKIEIRSMQSQNSTSNNLICEKCGAPLIIRDGKYGKFYGCTNYPNCRYTKDF